MCGPDFSFIRIFSLYFPLFSKYWNINDSMVLNIIQNNMYVALMLYLCQNILHDYVHSENLIFLV